MINLASALTHSQTTDNGGPAWSYVRGVKRDKKRGWTCRHNESGVLLNCLLAYISNQGNIEADDGPWSEGEPNDTCFKEDRDIVAYRRCLP